MDNNENNLNTVPENQVPETTNIDTNGQIASTENTPIAQNADYTSAEPIQPPVTPPLDEAVTPTAQPQAYVGQPTQQVPTSNVFQPASNVTGSVTGGVSSVPPAKKRNKLLFIGLPILLVVLLLSGGGAFAWYTVMNNKPEKVLADAFTNTVGDLLAKRPSEAVGVLTYEMKGSSDMKLTLNFSGKNSGQNSQSDIDAKLDLSGKSFNLKASAVVFGTDEYYVKLSNVQKTIDTFTEGSPEYDSYAQMVKPIVSKIDGKWIVITKDDLSELGSSATDTDVDKCTTAVQHLKLDKKDTKQLKKLFSENQFIIASETLPGEKVKDEASFHFKLDFNDKAAVAFAKQVIDLPSMATVKKDCDIKPEDFSNKVSEFDKDASNGDTSDVKPVVELWVGKKTRRPTQVRISADDKELTASFVSQINLNATNISVEKPSGAIPIKQLQQDVKDLLSTGTSSYSTDPYSSSL